MRAEEERGAGISAIKLAGGGGGDDHDQRRYEVRGDLASARTRRAAPAAVEQEFGEIHSVNTEYFIGWVWGCHNK
jgi:hypothetical protein